MTEVERIARSLTSAERLALRPCAKNRQVLLKHGLATWKNVPGHKFLDLKLTNLGFKVRDYLYGKEES